MSAPLALADFVAVHPAGPDGFVRADVDADSWTALADGCAAGAHDLVSLWADDGAMRLALSDAARGLRAILSLRTEAGRYPSVAARHPPALRLERAMREVDERRERLRAEQALRESSTLYSRLVESLRDYAVMLLDRDGCIRAWNKASEDIFGWTREEVLGRHAGFLFRPAEGSALEAELRQAEATGRDSDDRWLVRRLPSLIREAGAQVVGVGSHGFTETTEGGYMLTVVERGADMLHASGQIGGETAAMLKAEARRRVEAQTFFGHIAYGSVVARK